VRINLFEQEGMIVALTHQPPEREKAVWLLFGCIGSIPFYGRRYMTFPYSEG
jgi:lipid-A-disaccharide synthase-like uncharacterized protein